MVSSNQFKKSTRKPPVVLLGIVFLLLSVIIFCTIQLVMDNHTQAQAQSPQKNPPVSTATPDTTNARNQAQIKLQQYSKAIENLRQWGSDPTAFEPGLNETQSTFEQAKTLADYQAVSTRVDTDLTAMHLPLVQAEANFLVQDYHTTLTTWRSTHIYSNPYDGVDYQLGGEYDSLLTGYGVGNVIDQSLETAEYEGTTEAYQTTIDLVKNYTVNFQAMQSNANDTTAWNQPHQTDQQLMQHYQATAGTTVVVSLQEQAIRVYQDGQLARAIPIVSGRPERPTPPGYFVVDQKLSPAKFVSGDSPDSPFYYEPLDLSFALRFTEQGHYFHDAHWRTTFGNTNGVRMNYPHAEADPSARSGSHGCVNMPYDDAAWMFNNVGSGAHVIVY